MRKIEDIKEIREILLNLACEVKRICEENNLRYYLSGGTLLGAVRHKGFIPWDDDIDMHMPRPDYERFIEIYSKSGGNNILYAQETNDKYLYSFIKIAAKNTLLYEKGAKNGVDMGVYLDIFPIDGLGESMEDAHKVFKKIKMPIDLLMSYRVDKWRKNVPFYKNCLVCGAYLVAKLFGHKYLSKKIKDLALTYKFDESSYVGSFVDEVGDRRIHKKEFYDGKCELEFEGITFSVPKEYKTILKMFYGDYMKLPPKEKQVLTHNYEAFIIEEK